MAFVVPLCRFIFGAAELQQLGIETGIGFLALHHLHIRRQSLSQLYFPASTGLTLLNKPLVKHGALETALTSTCQLLT